VSGGVGPVAAQLVAALVAGGVEATLDSADVVAPGALVSVGPIGHELLDGGGFVALYVDLVVSDTDPLAALDKLSELLAKTVDVVDADEDSQPQALLLPGAPSALPSIRLTCRLPYDRYTED
jgi:hypothetical protein